METNVWREEALRELTGRLLPFWRGLRDDRNGGYIGGVSFDLTADPLSEKGCILNSRILYFFSGAFRLLRDPALLEEAEHAYAELLRMVDVENGGVFWSLTADGQVLDDTKHTYNQAFAIYALSSFYDVSGRKDALEKAMGLYRMVEKRCRDSEGYLEAFHRDFTVADNDKLSENGVMAYRTMNTMLHVLEGYTELYRVSGNEDVKRSLLAILKSWEEHVYNEEKHRQEVFFDISWNTLIDLHSFGHDIETSWLMDRTLEVLGDAELTARIRPKLMSLADETYRLAFTPEGFLNEMEKGVIDRKRIWWVQAEALLGFLNAYQKTGEERYLKAAESQWHYILEKVTDHRPGGEWFWAVQDDGTPTTQPIVEPWKCPYHNGRMIFEMASRLQNIK